MSFSAASPDSSSGRQTIGRSLGSMINGSRRGVSWRRSGRQRGWRRAEATLSQYELVRERVRGPRTAAGVPDVRIPPPDLTCYDRLLGSYAQHSEVAP